MEQAEWEKAVERFAAWLGVVASLCVINLLFAFPLKWTWNYVMPELFGLSTLTWGKAWCLDFVAITLIKSIHAHR